MRTIISNHAVLMKDLLTVLAEEARKTLKGMTLQQLHSKYVDMVSRGSHNRIVRPLFSPFLDSWV